MLSQGLTPRPLLGRLLYDRKSPSYRKERDRRGYPAVRFPFLREYFWVQFREKCFVQALDYVGDFVFFDHERQVDFRGALGDHANLFVGELAENQGCNSGRVAQILADQADDGFAALVFYVGQFGEVGGQGRDCLIGVDRERNADFGGRDYVDGNFMAIESLEDRAQKSMGQKHAGSGHVDDGDAFLGGDGFEDVLALRGAGSDARAFAGGVARVQHVDGNIFLDGGQHRRGVQDFRAEVGEFGGLVEADDFNPARLGTDSGIGGEDAVDVGPDLDAVGAQASADDRGGKIRTASSDGCRDAGAIGSDEAAHHRHLACLQQRLNFFLQAGIRFLELRDCLHVVAVGDQNFAGVDVGSVQSSRGERGRDDFAGKHFAEGGDVVGGAGSDFADGGNAAQQFVERFEVRAQFGMEFREECGAQQFAGGVVVTFLERAAEFEGGLALAGAGGLRHGQQGVGDLSHGADHDDGFLPAWLASHHASAVAGEAPKRPPLDWHVLVSYLPTFLFLVLLMTSFTSFRSEEHT